MQLKKEDKILGAVATSMIRKGDGLCPTDEEFALYIEGKLDKDRRKSFISHFISCKECKERLAIPVHPLEATGKANNIIEKLLGFSWRPLVAAPIALAFVVLLALTLNVYLIQDGSEESYQEVYRDADLIALKQIDLTPSLLTAIKEGDKDRLKNELKRKLPPGSEVSNIVVADEFKRVTEAKEGDKVNLVLYGNGVLKVKLKE